MGSQLGDVCGQVGLWHLTVNTLRAGAFISRSGHGGGLQFHFMCNKAKLARMLEAARQVPCAGTISLGTPLPLDMVSSSCPIWIECALQLPGSFSFLKFGAGLAQCDPVCLKWA